MDEPSFETLTNKRMAQVISESKRRVIFAAPGMAVLVAEAIVDALRRQAPPQVTVILDCSEEACRLGYGFVESARILKKGRCEVTNLPGLRTGILVSDDEVWCFTPVPLCVEGETKDTGGSNAIRLGKAAGESITHAVKEELKGESLSEKTLASVETRLKDAPPVRFDIQRQVRVYQAYVQYVELALEGCSITRRTVPLPSDLIHLVPPGDDLEPRLKTSFSLFETSGEKVDEEMESFERSVAEVRKDYTRSLKKFRGVMILRHKRREFDARITELKSDLDARKERLKALLRSEISDAEDRIIGLILRRVLAAPPKALTTSVATPLTPAAVTMWLRGRLWKCFPDPEKIVAEMRIECHFKDVTLETLDAAEFLAALKKAWPDIDWDQPMKQFMAASETGQHLGEPAH